MPCFSVYVVICLVCRFGWRLCDPKCAMLCSARMERTQVYPYTNLLVEVHGKTFLRLGRNCPISIQSTTLMRQLAGSPGNLELPTGLLPQTATESQPVNHIGDLRLLPAEMRELGSEIYGACMFTQGHRFLLTGFL